MPKPRERLLVVDLGARAETTEWVTSTVGKGRVQLVWAKPFDDGDTAALDQFYADDWASVTVCSPSYAVLRQALWALPSFGRSPRVLIAVDEAPRLVRRLGPRRHSYPPLREARATDVGGEKGPLTQLTFEFSSPVWLHRVVVDHVVVGPHTFADVPAGSMRIAIADPGAARWVAGDPTARTPGNFTRTWFSDNPALPAYDVVLGRTPAVGALTVDVSGRCPPVDVRVINPHGFRSDAPGAVATATVSAVGGGDQFVSFVRDDATLTSFDPMHGLSTTQVAVLRDVAYVDGSGLSALPAADHAGVVAQLAAAAVPVYVGRLPEATRALLDAGLADCLERQAPETLGSGVDREVAALHARRAALAAHSVSAARSGLLEGAARSRGSAATVSALLVTRRPKLLAGALAGLRAQTHDNLEVIVAVHGDEPPDELAGELAGFAHSVVLTEPATTVFGDVLNRATAAAAGEFVAKIDDDDWYGPHHISDLLAAIEWSGAQLVGCLDEFVYLVQQDVTIRRHDFSRYEQVAGRVAGPTMLLRREDLRGLGGWRAVPAGVDLSLIHNVRDAGGVIYRTHGLGFMLCRHGRGHTWRADDERFLSSARERWEGFRPPPEIGDVGQARARLELLGSLT